jgi:CRISPR/Cas system-associated exonuclease Cas4 (RecB family)
VEREYTISNWQLTDSQKSNTKSQKIKIGGRIDRLDLVDEGTAKERIRVVDYKTSARQPKPLPDVDAIFDPKNIHEHSDYYLQALLYADIVRSDRPASVSHLPSEVKVSPALLFIQHAGADDYDPTLSFGREKIMDIEPYSQRFNELLLQTITDIYSPNVPYRPTSDLQVCASCPFATICRR